MKDEQYGDGARHHPACRFFKEIMNTTKMTSVVATILLSSFGAFAGDKPVPTVQQAEQQKRVTDQQKSPDKEKVTECFRRHAHLMDKPALKNERVCWRAHGYLTADAK